MLFVLLHERSRDYPNQMLHDDVSSLSQLVLHQSFLCAHLYIVALQRHTSILVVRTIPLSFTTTSLCPLVFRHAVVYIPPITTHYTRIPFQRFPSQFPKSHFLPYLIDHSVPVTLHARSYDKHILATLESSQWREDYGSTLSTTSVLRMDSRVLRAITSGSTDETARSRHTCRRILLKSSDVAPLARLLVHRLLARLLVQVESPLVGPSQVRATPLPLSRLQRRQSLTLSLIRSDLTLRSRGDRSRHRRNLLMTPNWVLRQVTRTIASFWNSRSRSLSLHIRAARRQDLPGARL